MDHKKHLPYFLLFFVIVFCSYFIVKMVNHPKPLTPAPTILPTPSPLTSQISFQVPPDWNQIDSSTLKSKSNNREIKLSFISNTAVLGMSFCMGYPKSSRCEKVEGSPLGLVVDWETPESNSFSADGSLIGMDTRVSLRMDSLDSTQLTQADRQLFKSFLKTIKPITQPSPASSLQACKVGGCSSQLCVEPGEDGVSTCEYRADYACYKSATCERQSDGTCGWTKTQALTSCLQSPPPLN